MSSFLFRLGRSAARHPFRMLAAWILIAVAVMGLKGSFGGETEDNFRIPGAESQAAQDRLEERFPIQAGASGRIVLKTPEGRLDTPANKAAVTETLRLAAEGHDVAGVSDPFDPRGPTISDDGRIAFAEIRYHSDELEAESLEDIEAAADTGRDAGIQVELSSDLIDQAIEGQEIVGLAVAVIVLLIAFGSVVAMGVPIVAALMALGIGLGGVGILAGFTDVPTVSPMLATMIGLGVGIDYALFVMTRHRHNLAEGMDVAESAGVANATAGQAVLFAGMTVVIAIMGLQVTGLGSVTAMGYSSAIVVAVSMAAAVTLLPALLGLAGQRVNGMRAAKREKRLARELDHSRTISGRWADHVGRHPWRYALASFAALVAFAAPVVALRIGFTDDGTAATDTTQRKAYDILADGFGAGFNGPLQIVVDTSGDDGAAAAQRVAAAVAEDPGIARVVPPVANESGDTTVIQVVPTTAPEAKETGDLVDRLRDDVVPAALDGSDTEANVGGNTAALSDVSERITQRLPLFIGAVVALSFILLMVVFRSVLVPLKAAIMNLLSIGAAYGVIVAVFQWGWLADVFGVDQTVPVNPFVPMIMFAILFGLSMDYEVFLLSRIREEFLKHGDGHRSVVDGLGSTARVITSAALIMISVFGAFVLSEDLTLKMFGLGLATAVLIDATIVRMVLVPSTMSLLGEANWWLPRWLDRILPHLDLEAEPELAPVPASEEDEGDDDERELEAA